MKEQTVVSVTIALQRGLGGLFVQRTVNYAETTIASGKMCKRIDRFENLNQDEAVDVLDAIAAEIMPGDSLTSSALGPSGEQQLL